MYPDPASTADDSTRADEPRVNGHAEARSDGNPPISRRAILVIGTAGAVAVLLITALVAVPGTPRGDINATAADPASAGQHSQARTVEPSTTGPAWHTVPGIDTVQRLKLFADQLVDADADATAGPYTCRRIQAWNRSTAAVHRTDTTSCRNDTDGSGLEFGHTLPDRPGLLPLPDGTDRDQFATAPPYVEHHLRGELRLDVPEPVPTDPAELMDAVLQHRPEILAEAGPGFLVNRVADLLTRQYLDRAHRAAALLVLARAQGLTFAGPMHDLAGRPGMAFTLSLPDSMLTCIFNPTTGQLLAFIEVVPNDRNTKTIRPGLWGYELLLDMHHQTLLPDPSMPPGTSPS